MAQNALTWTLQQLDGSGNTLARRVTTLTDTAPSVGDYRGAGNLINASLTAITLPITQVRQLYIKNNSASANITITWTPNGGVSATILVIGPGDGIGFWHTSANNAFGISALSLQSSSSAGTPFELFLGG